MLDLASFFQEKILREYCWVSLVEPGLLTITSVSFTPYISGVRVVITTNKRYPLSFETLLFRNDYPWHGRDRKTPLGIVTSLASFLATTLYH